ncbi:helix-turn-helix transcriptional regulator [Streptomyces sp. NPDC059456]|uniref:helix-turn-helix transcriptional regulator n=1 Tax=Streptomyces sp. NPDC059456 TaxID=3346838 RepID=UPI0036BD9C18
MSRMRLNQTDLAGRAGPGRTTVSEALSPAKPAPSPETVAALARALQLPVEELRELQRSAVEDTEGEARSVPRRSIGEWDPHDLEVHPAGPGEGVSGPGRSGTRTMPGYVRREHDLAATATTKPCTTWPSGGKRPGTRTAPKPWPDRPPTTATPKPCTDWPGSWKLHEAVAVWPGSGRHTYLSMASVRVD